MSAAAFVATDRPAGAGGRLGPAMQRALDQAAARLAVKLAKANTATYHHAMQRTAKAFGVKAPKAIGDPAALAAIAARAKVSAQSIVTTQATRMAALVAQHGGRGEAQPAFAQWEAGQRARIAQYEAGMTVSAAASDFSTRNALSGTERCEPGTGQCTDCQDAIAAGAVPLGTLPEMPLHLNCVHSIVATYDAPADPSTLWLGGA